MTKGSKCNKSLKARVLRYKELSENSDWTHTNDESNQIFDPNKLERNQTYTPEDKTNEKTYEGPEDHLNQSKDDIKIL
jgi:hypothetical protein